MRRFFRLVAVLGVAAMVLLPAAVRAECTLVLGWEPYAVYTFLKRGSILTGADIELIRAAAEEVGCTLQYREYGWQRILEQLKTGGIDVATSATLSPERERYAVFSVPYRRAEMAIYVRRGESGRFDIPSLQSIAGTDFRLGTIGSYEYGAPFSSLILDPAFAERIRPAADNKAALRRLVDGRVDGFLTDDVGVMVAEAKALGIEAEVERYPLSLPGQQIRFMFSRVSVDPAIVAAFDDSVERMKADGRVQAILEKFLN
jgi:polar amino acid transport system substrate-binding protein